MTKGRGSTKDSLCFCEYDNIKGERSHLLATLCDCDAIDSLCDSCLKCQPIPEEKIILVVETIEDRIRFPFCNGKGAVKLNFELAYPGFALPLALYLGAYGPYWTFFSFSTFFIILFFSSRLCSYRKRSRLFLATSMISFISLFAVFITVVVGFRKLLLWEIILTTTLFSLSMFLLIQAKRNPGYLRSENSKYHHPKPSLDVKDTEIDASDVTWVDSRPIVDGYLQVHCAQCQINRPPRSGHCTKCDSCVLDRDHHCLWLDVCIGRHNHRVFFFFLLLSFITGVYGVHLTTTTLCTPEIYLDWFLVPADCRFLYADFPSGLCVCSIILACLELTFEFILLVHQCILISQNLTGQEYHRARQRGWVKFWGFVVLNNINNKGFIKNWTDFLKDRRSQKYVGNFIEV